MTPTEAVFAVCAGFVLSQIGRVTMAVIRYHRTKTLYVDEIKCPACYARPGIKCFTEAGYAHQVRWDAVGKENDKREARRAVNRKS